VNARLEIRINTVSRGVLVYSPHHAGSWHLLRLTLTSDGRATLTWVTGDIYEDT